MAAGTTVTRSPEQSKTTAGSDDVEEEEETQEREVKKMKTNPASVEGASGDDGDEELEISSPLREPYIPDELDDPYRYPRISAAYKLVKDEFSEKQDRVNNLPTRKYFHSPVLHVGDPGRKAALSTARSLLRLSSTLDGEPLAHSAGLWIDWDEESRTGIVLTTAHLIRAKQPSAKDRPRSHLWRKGRYEYHRGAQITVHLLDDTTAEGHLVYHQEHYDIAFFKVAVDRRVQSVTFADTVGDGQEAMRLGREVNLNLKIVRGTVEYENNPIPDEGHHYMHFSRDGKYEKADIRRRENEWRSNAKGFYVLPRCEDGGDPIIDFGGKVVGMTNRCGSWYFVPSSVLNGCIVFGCIPRPLLGLQFEAIKFLYPTHAEYIWRKLNIDDGLVVEEVSAVSHAEEVGIRVGDIIQSINGERISTTTELENKLLSICRGNFDRGTDINAKVDVSVRVFHTANRLWRTQHLTVNVSDRREVVERAYYPITNREEFSAQVSHEQVDSDSDSAESD